MTHAHRTLLKWARLVHVYLTLFGCLLILFFAILTAEWILRKRAGLP